METGVVCLGSEQERALEIIEDLRGCVFVTGRAGTGKSTFLRHFCANTQKKVVIVAPTGVAALNIGGQTIHSFFQLPTGIISPGDVKSSRFASVIQQMEVLVVDEVSMARSDILAAVDTSLRMHRTCDLPFGGVTVVLCGDLFQLPPVVRENEEDILEEVYGGPYFFTASAFREVPPLLIELSHVYRQCDEEFITLLNEIREGWMSERTLGILNARVGREEGEIILTATNAVAAQRNCEGLAKLKSQPRTYHADVWGTFDTSIFPTEGELTLKAGARVMLVRNDPMGRWVNGTLGYVVELGGEEGVVVDVDGVQHVVGRTSWDNIRYRYDSAQRRIVAEVVGSFTQYPLRLAWAVTIHKSQGQTFQRVHVDIGRGAFAHGQVYVALSRCRTLGGLTLERSLTKRDLVFDRRIYGYREVFRSVG